MKKYLLLLVLIVVIFFLIQKFAFPDKKNYIFGGTLSPGKLIGFQYKNSEFLEKIIDEVSPLSIYDIKVGDIYNNGKNVVVAAISKAEYDAEYCLVKIYELEGRGYKISVLDELNEIFCRDLEIGDAYNRGENVILLATHGEGIILAYRWDKKEKKWEKEIIMQNIVREMDGNDSRRMTDKPLPYHTAIHTVEIADIDGDGKNEVVAAHGTANTYKGEPESWVGVYRYADGKWEREIAGHIQGRQHRRLRIANNVYGDGKAVIIAGTWPNSILKSYQYKDNKWDDRIIDEQVLQDNNKAIIATDLDRDDRDEIIVVTDPDGLVILYDFVGSNFTKTIIDKQTESLKEEAAGRVIGGFDALAFDIDGDGQEELYVASVAIESEKLTAGPRGYIGWIRSTSGFLLQYKKTSDGWERKILDGGPYWSLGAGKIWIK